jgi:EmrB/QacA subfamily drug resistance transporter
VKDDQVVMGADEAFPAEVLPEAEPAKALSPMAQRLTSLAVASALLMEFIDSTSLSTALPTLAKAFQVDPVHLKLALTGYILALAVFTPVSGWAAEKLGAKRVFLTAMTVFLLGSMLCGFSRSLEQLVAARLVQGLGGAMMTPVARLIVVGSAPRERLIQAMGWFTTPALIGPLIGPPIAGLILSVASWPWIFFVNLPVGLLGMIAVVRLVPKITTPDPGGFDWAGFGLSALAITSVVLVAETAGLPLLPDWGKVVVLAVAAVSLWAYIRHSRKRARPILDLSLFKYPTFRASLLGGNLVRLGVGAGPFLLPLLLQVGLHWSPLKAGLVSLVQYFGVMSARPFTAFSLKLMGFRTMLVVFVTLTALLTAAPGFFRADTPIWLMVVVLVLSGFCRANQFISANTIAYADVPNDKVARASTMAAVMQQIALALGISFGGFVLHLARGSSGLLTPDRFVLPFMAIGATSLMAIPIYLMLHPSAGDLISGRTKRG